MSLGNEPGLGFYFTGTGRTLPDGRKEVRCYCNPATTEGETQEPTTVDQGTEETGDKIKETTDK